MRKPTRDELVERRAAILRNFDLTERQFEEKIRAGSLVGDEWAASAEIEEIDYLLEGVE